MYVHNNTYDTALPLITKQYSDKLALEKCIVKRKSASTGIIKKLFGDNYFIKEYGDFKIEKRTPLCSFDLMKTILKNENINMDNNDIKKVLVTFYGKISGKGFGNLLRILSSEGKEQWIQNILGNKLTLEAYIMSDNYFLTMIDLWCLAIELDVPIVFLGKAVNKINDKIAFATHPKRDAYYFIRLFSPMRNTLPRYHLVESPETLINIPVSSSKLPKVYFEIERKIGLKKKKHITIMEYIQNYNIQ